MIIDVFLLVVYIVLIVLLTILAIRSRQSKDRGSLIMSIFCMILLVTMFPITYDKAVLTEYEFSEFRDAGRIDYISPFTGEKIINDNISSLPLYNDMRKHNHIRMEKYYSIVMCNMYIDLVFSYIHYHNSNGIHIISI